MAGYSIVWCLARVFLLDRPWRVHPHRKSNPRVFENPLSLDQALSRVQSWLDQPCARLIHPTARHWIIFQKMLIEGQAVANLVTDAHLAALASEHGCELISHRHRLLALSWEIKAEKPLK